MTQEKEKAWQRLLRHGDAYYAEWRRLVEENGELQRALGELRGRWGLTLPAKKRAWWVTFDAEQLRQLRAELTELGTAYAIPNRLHDALFTYAVWGWPAGLKAEMGFPGGCIRKREDGSFEDVLEVTPETDIDNPLVWEYIRDWVYRKRGYPPRPTPIPGTRGKLDWRPVLEWKAKHPGVSNEQIDTALGYAAGRTRRKLAELEARDDEVDTKAV